MSLNTKRLAKHYERLTPRERFSLIVAAGIRSDEGEREQLVRSAPKKVFSVPNHRGYAEGFSEAGNVYITWQLETGIWMWRALSVIETDRKENIRLAKCLEMFANRFLIWQKAWRRLCDAYAVDGDGVLSVHPAWNTVQELADLAEIFAILPAEAAVWVSERDEEASLVTPEDIYEFLKESVEERVRWWL